ncbi:MAG: M24 family metallopeptidase [Bacillota bacterium]
MHIIPKEELQKRTSRLQEQMAVQKLDGVLVVQNMDLYYFTGTAQNAHLFIPVDGLPLLMVRKDLARAKQESTLERVVPLASLKGLSKLLQEYGYKIPGRMGLEMDVVPAGQFLKYQEIFPQTDMVDAAQIIRKLRMIKSPYELSRLREAARRHDAMFKAVPGILREGMTEQELAAELEFYSRKQGHLGIIPFRGFNQMLFFGHAMSGSNAAVSSGFDTPLGGPGNAPMFPQGGNSKIIARQEPVIIDFVGNYEGYLVDATRVFSLGSVDPQLAKAHQLSLNIQEAIIERGLPGKTWGELYDVAMEMAKASDFGDHFLGFGSPVGFVGHGLGLELDELPVLARGFNQPLEEGMVIALEPKFVFPSRGAVGIENTLVVTAQGMDKLTTTIEELVVL